MSSSKAGRSFPLVWSEVKDWQGWLRPTQAERLWEAARNVPPDGQIVEIGSFRGKSTAILSAGSDASVRVYAIDPHAGNDRKPGAKEGSPEEGTQDYDAFVSNLALVGVTEHVIHVREFSSNAHPSVGGTINLLYIDGAHGYGPASDDLRTWGSRVVEGGEMYVHDVFNSFWVTLAIFCHVLLSRKWRYLGRESSLAMYRRENVSIYGVCSNLGRHILSLPVLVRSILVKGLRPVHLEAIGVVFGHRPRQGSY